MSATTESKEDRFQAIRQAVHSRCIVCGQKCSGGLNLEFEILDDGSVSAVLENGRHYEGYDGLLHGGIIAAIADGAMTNCLFAHGITAVTAELNVRFRHPLTVNTPLRVVAKILRRNEPLFVIEAELIQESQIKARATGKFMEQSTVQI